MNSKRAFFLFVLMMLQVFSGHAFAQHQKKGGLPVLQTHAAMAQRVNNPTVTLIVDKGLVRANSSLKSKIIFNLTKEDRVSVIKEKGDWYLVETADGRVGWSHRSLYAEAKQGQDFVGGDTVPESFSEPPAGTASADPQIDIEPVDNDLLTLNLIDVDIREILSAIAIEKEINIATSKDVSGKISVHLFKMTLKKALDAVTMAGGYNYHKHEDLYYVYKPKVEKDPEAKRLQMRIFKLRYAEIDKIQDILGAIPGIRMLKIHDPSKTIVVEDTPENIKKIETILNYWDTMPKQVMIEAKILEVDLTDDMTLGVNWEMILGDAGVGTGGFSTATMPTGPGTSPIPDIGQGIFANLITGAGTNQQFTAALDALQTKTKINVLSTPKILAIHGKPARVQVGGQQGYKVTTTNLGISTETIEFIDTGTILDITPYIDDDNNILLDVRPSINTARVEIGGIPVVNSTSVTTWLMARNGETVFIGGLIQDTNTETKDGIPLLADIPVLGWLFGRSSRGTAKTELIVLITPRIIEYGIPNNQEALEKAKEMEKRFNK